MTEAIPEIVGTVVMIREATDRDGLADWIAVKNRIEPLGRVTLAEIEHERASEPDGVLLVATIGGRLAGAGVAKPHGAPGSLFAMVRVLPEMRGRGVGSAIYQAVSAHAGSLGLSHLIGRIEEDDTDSLAWVGGRGFVEIARESELLLTLTNVPDNFLPKPPRNVELVSLAARPDLALAAHQIESEVIGDVLGPFPQQPEPYETWAGKTIDVPGFLPEGSFVALVRGKPVGYAGLHRKDPILAEHLLTGVLRDARGRGIATALKGAQIEWARQAGYQQLVTWTSSRNDPMRAINLRLRYVEQPASIFVAGPISSL